MDKGTPALAHQKICCVEGLNENTQFLDISTISFLLFSEDLNVFTTKEFWLERVAPPPPDEPINSHLDVRCTMFARYGPSYSTNILSIHDSL